MAKFDFMGREIPDTTPAETPPHLSRAVSRHEEMKAYIRAELSRQMEDAGMESFEDADDFEVDEDPDILSPYELSDAPVEWPGGEKDADADPPPQPGANNAASSPGGPFAGNPDAGRSSLDTVGQGNRSSDRPVSAPATGKPSDVGGAERS